MKQNIYDQWNTKYFKEGNEEASKLYCSMCGDVTNYNDSISNRGYNLICMKCQHKIARLLHMTPSQVMMCIQKEE